MTTIAHLSDLHFGRDVDLDQIRALEGLLPSVQPKAIIISGDLTQRARHGEFQRALAFVETIQSIAPVHVVPGNHDVEWWRSPLDLFGAGKKWEKYLRYFGPELSPITRLPGLTIASALTSHGVVFGSLTWKFWRDTAVKGHLPTSEVAQVRAVFSKAPPGDIRVLVVHQNILRGEISRRMGLARWKRAHSDLATLGADVIVCGHDHQEGCALLGDSVVVATASTHTARTRGGRPSAFNLIEVEPSAISVRHFGWARESRCFVASDPIRFRRQER